MSDAVKFIRSRTGLCLSDGVSGSYLLKEVVDAVGTTIADRPPHRSVRARLRIRLPPRMGGDEAFQRIGMQNAGFWNPAFEDRCKPIPDCSATLTATA